MIEALRAAQDANEVHIKPLMGRIELDHEMGCMFSARTRQYTLGPTAMPCMLGST
jgi:hypothetical protein